MSMFTLIIILCLIPICCINGLGDFVEEYNGFTFVYHDNHRLLLALKDRNCYFVPIQAEIQSGLHYKESRNVLQDWIISAITQSYAGVRATTLGALRDQFRDRLADFHCLEKDVFTVHLTTDTERRIITVVFNVGLTSNTTYTSPSDVITFDDVVVNAGGGYVTSSGRFIAPVSGRFYVAVTTVSPDNNFANVAIVTSAGSVICSVTSDLENDVGSCQGVVTLTAGQQIFVQTSGSPNSFRAHACTFAGFLFADEGDNRTASFHARTTASKPYPRFTRWSWDEVLDNHGDVFNPATGEAAVTAKNATCLLSSSFALAASPGNRTDVRLRAANYRVPLAQARCDDQAGDVEALVGVARITVAETVSIGTEFTDVTVRGGASFTGIMLESGVAFNVRIRLDSSTNFELRTVHIVLNSGESYNQTAGEFRAPVGGMYWLAVTTNSRYPSNQANVEVMGGGKRVCRVHSGRHYDVASCQGALHLTKGDKVWVQTSNCPSCLVDYTSYFCGVLIKQDAD